MSKDERITQLEDENRLLKAQLEQKRSDFPVGEELKKRRDTLETFDKMPNGAIYRSARDVRTGILGFDYVSGTWEKIMGLTAEATLADAQNVFNSVHPDDLPLLMQRINESLKPLRSFEIEVRYLHPATKKEIWIQISSYPRRVGDYIYADGFIFDITQRKNIEVELAKHREKLELLVQERTDELAATNEKLTFTNEELTVTNEELARYREHLEEIVIQRTLQVIKDKNTIETLINSIADATLIRLKIDPSEVAPGQLTSDTIWVKYLQFVYAKSNWNIPGVLAIDGLKSMQEVLYVFYQYRPEDIARFRSFMREAMISLTRFSMEACLILPENETQWHHISVRPYRENEIVVFDLFFFDITNHKNTELALAENEQKYRFIFENTKEVFFIQDIEKNKFTFVGGSTFDVFGFTSDDIMQFVERHTVYDIFVPEYVEKVNNLSVEHAKKYYETGEIQRFQYEAQMYRIDGSVFWAEVSMQLIPDETGKLTMAVGVASNIDERKKAEEALIESEKKYRFVFENTKEVFFIQDLENNKFTFTGGATFEVFGFTNDEMMHFLEIHSIFDIVVPEYIEKVHHMSVEFADRYYKTGELPRFQYEAKMYRKDGSVFWAEVSMQLIANETGILTKAVGIVSNIDERKEAEHALVESERNFRLISDYSKDVLWIADFNTLKHTFVSGAYYEMWGYTYEEFVNMYLFDLSTPQFHKEQEKLLQEILGKYQETGTIDTVHVESLERHKDGTELWIDVSAEVVFDENGKPTHIIGISRNIDARKKAELALAESERKQRLVFDNTKDVLWIADYETAKFTFVGGNCVETFGDVGEAYVKMGMSFYECFLPEIRGKIEALMKQKVKEYYETGVQHFEVIEQHYNKNQELIWMETVFQLVPDENGEITQIVGVEKDIDERKRMEIELAKYRENLEHLVRERTDELAVANEELASTNEELSTINDELHCKNACLADEIEIRIENEKELERYRTQLEQMVEQKTKELIRAKNKAEESDKLKSAFLANMSHEIRTPLNGIVGFLQIIDSDNIHPVRRQEFIKVINNNSRQLAKLIDDIIDVSKIEAKQMTICPVPVQLNELMNEMRLFFETYLQSAGKEYIKLILDDSGFIDQCLINIDTIRLRQVFNNLISNAIKFTEKGYIRFGYRQSAPDQLEFVVEDTGIGLASDQHEVIFEHFRQAHLGNNRQYGGTGLGLTISRSLVQLMGGNMWVESAEGSGASFYFTIPYIPVETEDD